jgi:nucleoid DNA-binding protein
LSLRNFIKNTAELPCAQDEIRYKAPAVLILVVNNDKDFCARQMQTLIESFLTIVPKELAKGNIVELGDFGSFWLKTNTEGAETAADVRANQINTVLPRFNPGKEFKRTLENIEFNKN